MKFQTLLYCILKMSEFDISVVPLKMCGVDLFVVKQQQHNNSHNKSGDHASKLNCPSSYLWNGGGQGVGGLNYCPQHIVW